MKNYSVEWVPRGKFDWSMDMNKIGWAFVLSAVLALSMCNLAIRNSPSAPWQLIVFVFLMIFICAMSFLLMFCRRDDEYVMVRRKI